MVRLKTVLLFISLYSVHQEAKFMDEHLVISSSIQMCLDRTLTHQLTKFYLRGKNEEQKAPLFFTLYHFCLCKGDVEKKETMKYQTHNISYFFQTREDYFTQVDECLYQTKIESSEFKILHALLVEMEIKPLISDFASSYFLTHFVKEVKEDLGTFGKKNCLEESMLMYCHKRDSLYFSYRCLNRLKTNGAKLNSFYELCLENDSTPLGEDLLI